MVSPFTGDRPPLRFAHFGIALSLLLAMLHAGWTTEHEVERPLTVTVNGIEGELLGNVRAYLGMAQLDGEPVRDDARLRYLQSAAGKEIRDALQPFGYYAPTVKSRLERKPESIEAIYDVSPGEPVKISSVDLQITGAGRDQEAFQEILASPGIEPGQILRHERYSSLKGRIDEAAARFGYPEGRYRVSRLEVDPPARSARVQLHFDTGPRYRFGEVSVRQDMLRPQLIDRYVGIHQGENYDSEELLRLQSVLFGSDYFQTVLVSAEDPLPDTRSIPVEIALEPRAPHRYGFGLGYATDTGPRVRLNFDNRLVNRRGHRYESFVLLSGTRNQAGFSYRVPGARPATDQYLFNTSYTDEDTDNKQTEYLSLVAAYQRQTTRWQQTNSLEYRRERFTIGEQTNTSTLLVPGTSWTRVSADDRFRTSRGYSVTLALRGAAEGFLSDTSFLQGRATGKYVYALNESNRLLVRGDLGSTWVEDFDLLPPSFRFYTGGDQSVRGYGYEDISPVNDEGDPVGGRHLLVGSLEYEYRVRGPWSVAAFVDAGDAFNDELSVKVGAGFGLRWQSPVGPVRLDIAHGFQDEGSSVRLHLSIGPDL
jgi:translocation and assembly module TamA